MRNQKNHLDLVRRRHPEWREHQLRWRWLLDSYEGGERYRQAIYGYDRRGLPMRNLVRHKREYPDPRDTSSLTGDMLSGCGFDSVASSTDDDYELRRARTPTPSFVAEVVESNLARIFSREVRRSGPPVILDWWSDVDACGTPIDHWMSETVAPLLLVLGQLDIYIDHPAASPEESIETQADIERLGLHRAVARVILPQDVLWWRLDDSGSRYLECLVREYVEDDEEVIERYRHWTSAESTLYSADGEKIGSTAHGFGRVPIVRVFDRRRPRARNTGHSRLEAIAERQREYYNRDSELILSDTTQAHPLLQGPEDYIQPDGTIPIGPSWLLPKKKNALAGNATYEGFDVVAFPKEGAESLRQNKADIRADIDRDAALVRPLGRDGAPQSGLSKLIDQNDGNNRLAKIARMLAHAELVIANLAYQVLCDGLHQSETDQTDPIEVAYPSEFDFYMAADVASAAADLQRLLRRAGSAPITESLLISRLARLCLPGMSDAVYARCEREIEESIALLAQQRTKSAGAG